MNRTSFKIIFFLVVIIISYSCKYRQSNNSLNKEDYIDFYKELKHNLNIKRIQFPLSYFEWENRKFTVNENYFSSEDSIFFEKQYNYLKKNNINLDSELKNEFEILNVYNVTILLNSWNDMGQENAFYVISYPIFNINKSLAIIEIEYKGGKYESYKKVSIYENYDLGWKEKEILDYKTW